MRIKAHDFRVCVWEYPYVSIHSPLFDELATRGYLLTDEAGDAYVLSWDTTSDVSPFGDVLPAGTFTRTLPFSANRLVVTPSAGGPGGPVGVAGTTVAVTEFDV